MRWRLTLTYVLLLAALLGAFAVYQYVSLRQSLISARVSEMQDDVTTARATLARNAQLTAKITALCSNTSTGSLAGARNVASSVATAVVATSGHTVAVVVYDVDIQPVAQAPPTASVPHLPAQNLEPALHRAHSDPEVVAGAGGQDLLVVGFPIRARPTSGKACGVAQLSASMAPLQAVLDDELLLLVIGAGATLFLALVIGVALTARALRPLRRLTETSGRLAAGDLGARSGVEDRNDEVGVLARSFDDMADRIERSFGAQQDSEERTRRFIADASHELRTPVTALIGYMDVIRRGAMPSPQALDAALSAMAREAERMRRLVLDLLTLARVDAQPPSSPSVVSLSEAVNDHLDDGVPGVTATVKRELDPRVLASVDRNALDTVIRNLQINAAKYAPGAAQTWRTWQEGQSVMLSVCDEGPGIAAVDLPHIFERFYRGEKARARVDGGSGLGLSIVQALARASGGDVSITSVEGGGTTVTVELPAGRPPEPPPAP